MIRTAFLAAVLALGAVVTTQLVVASADDADSRLAGDKVFLPTLSVELERARRATPYEMKTPRHPDREPSFFHITWSERGGGVGGRRIVSVDQYFEYRGQRLHTYQTNAHPADLARTAGDPVGRGERVTIGRRVWWRTVLSQGSARLVALSTRYEDGTTLVLDAPVQAESGAHVLAERLDL